MEVRNHVQRHRLLSAPPSRANSATLIHPKDLWPRLKTPQHQAIQQLLSELLARRLLPLLRKEVADEPR